MGLFSYLFYGNGGIPPPYQKIGKKIPRKMGQKGAKISVFLAKNRCFLADFFLSGIGGYPPPHPLTENHCAQKSLAERGGTPPPLTEKIR